MLQNVSFRHQNGIFTSNIMHITFDSFAVTSLIIGSDNPDSLSVHLSTSA